MGYSVALPSRPLAQIDAVCEPRTIRHATGAIIGIALVLTLGQLLFVLALAPADPGGRYQALCRWDGWLYANIAEHGYHSTIPIVPGDIERANVAFFPGYPILAGTISRALGISIPTALLLTSQLATWGFWTYWLLFFHRWRVPMWLTAIATTTVLVHPAAFFLVVSYSESLFLLGVLGYLYWTTSRRPRAWCWSILPGVLMTATRIGGLPVAFCPALSKWIGARLFRTDRGSPAIGSAGYVRLAVIGVAASLGGLGFFAYCQWRFGAWDVYMQTQQAGWKISADWLWWLRPTNLMCFASALYPNALWTDDLSRFSVLLTIAMFLLLGPWERRLAVKYETRWRERLVFYLAAAVLFFLHAAGVSPILMKSMVRYCLVVHILLLVAVVHMVRYDTRTALLPYRVGWLVGTICVGLACLQSVLAWRFLHDGWVA